VAVVHNGIIENYKPLKGELIAGGATFTSDTDTEVIAHLFTHYLDSGADIKSAAQATFAKLEGAYALGLIISGHDDVMIASRHGSPLAIGYGQGATYIGSDAFALAPFTNRITYLEDGDWALLYNDRVEIFDKSGTPQSRPTQTIDVATAMVDKGQYRHFMAKEIHEQPEVLSRSVGQYVDADNGCVILPENTPDYGDIDKVYLVACGTAYFAAQIARHWVERYAGLSAEIDIASEFRYRPIPLGQRSLAVFISQSGETADTLAALAKCKAAGIATLGVVNVPDSSITREVDITFPTYAGAEIGVASTKAFLAQMVALAALAIGLGRMKGAITPAQESGLVARLLSTPRLANMVLAQEDKIAALARKIADYKGVLFIGRGLMWAMALEGALKLKELSYIHAEGFPAGELKHGSIALIDETMPVIALAPSTNEHKVLFDKTILNMQEIMARGGQVVLVSDEAGLAAAGEDCMGHIALPEVDDLTAPIVYAIPMQLLAYYAAVAKGTDVDQPRNLAKSVTVE
ncbi:MAG: glutamine--fructose-6-phosphate transaminase (isomerizing), partial [Alphaproteobacteria bacterium]|nr:glutamine--fructose-6-phosphate transaminase (isomerizing) [Alphaproteobacteria bacterium]